MQKHDILGIAGLQSPTVLAGKKLVEMASKRGYNVKEMFRFREDVTTSNSAALYTTALASVVRENVEPNLVALELLQMNTDLMDGGGKGAIKLPKDQRITAAVVAEGGTVTYTGVGYTSITVTAEKRVAASKVTWEMVKRGMASTIVLEANRIGKAIARKIDSDILTAVENVVSAANSNRLATGGANTRVSYSLLTTAIGSFTANDYVFRYILLHPNDYAALLGDTDFKTAVLTQPVIQTVGGVQGGSRPYYQDGGTNYVPPAIYFHGAKVIVTSQVTDGVTLLVDSEELGTFCKETDVEVVDGRLPGSVDTEIIGLISFGVGIQNVAAVYGIVKAVS